MAKELAFSFQGEPSSFAISKIDRSKLYGYKEPEILDENESPCEFAVLADDGSTLIGGGDISMGYLTPDGLWTTKDQLTPVNIDGEKIEPVKSSFGSVIELETQTDIDEFLKHNIRLIYSLEPSTFSKRLKDALIEQKIFKFPYSYRGGLQADSAFLLQGADGNFYLLVGDELEIDFIGLKQVAASVQEEDDAEESDFMDFDMI